MIGSLKGFVIHIGKDYIIIDVNGVGYIVYCNISLLHNTKIGMEVSLFTETIVREDSISLFGFKTLFEKEWFNKLTTVKGVGNKVAQAILGILSPANLSEIIMLKDKDAFTQVSGVGPKLANRIITELKDVSLSPVHEVNDNLGANSKIIVNDSEYSILNDAVSALTNLGYNKVIAYNISKKLLQQNENLSISDLIKLSLKELAK